MKKQNILTGERPTGRLHLGHYFGALKKRVELQKDYNVYVIIADLQALTDNFNDPSKIKENIRQVVMDNLSVGIDPLKTVIFVQSMIPELSELTMYFSNLVTVNRLERNPTVKTEIKQKKELFGNDGESVTYGFLGYPVSQAADITCFDGTLVPVGDDQIPLVELTREVVRKFNGIYGKTFTEPEYLLSTNSRIKGLDGNDKMGKSLGNAIYLSDSEEEIAKKIMGALTDKNKIKKDDVGNPDECMVYYYSKLVNKNYENARNECKKGSRGCVNCKKELIENMNDFLKPFKEKRKYYENNPEIVDRIIKEGTDKAREKAREVIKRVKENMQIDYFN